MNQLKIQSVKKRILGGQITIYEVWSGKTIPASPKDIFVKEDKHFESESFADCYCYIKAKEERRFIDTDFQIMKDNQFEGPTNI